MIFSKWINPPHLLIELFIFIPPPLCDLDSLELTFIFCRDFFFLPDFKFYQAFSSAVFKQGCAADNHKILVLCKGSICFTESNLLDRRFSVHLDEAQMLAPWSMGLPYTAAAVCGGWWTNWMGWLHIHRLIIFKARSLDRPFFPGGSRNGRGKPNHQTFFFKPSVT